MDRCPCTSQKVFTNGRVIWCARNTRAFALLILKLYIFSLYCDSFQSSAPGSLSLNLRGLSADDVPRFHTVVTDMVPKCVTVPITTKSLCEKFKFSPKKVGLSRYIFLCLALNRRWLMGDCARVCAAKHANLNILERPPVDIFLTFFNSFGQDYDADRLMLSYLQLSEGTVVLLDETRLESCQVCILYAGRQAVNANLYIQFADHFNARPRMRSIHRFFTLGNAPNNF